MVERNIRAMRGPELRCKGWRQESILRLLENNLENAEAPEELIIYAGSPRAARDWNSYDAIVRELKRLETHQTLVVQSGKPVGVFETGEAAPLVIIVNGVSAGASEDEIDELFAKHLLMPAGMTAGAWQYIGSQGIVQGTYESFMSAARQYFDGSLSGRTILTAGSGGMGGGQPLAGKLAGAALLIADVEEPRLQRRVEEGYLDTIAPDVEAAIQAWLQAAKTGQATSIGVAANIVTVLDRIEALDIVPDILTDQTTTDPLHGYIPEGMSEADCAALRDSDPDALRAKSDETVRRHMESMLRLQERGSVVFEYGNGLRDRARQAGVGDAFKVGGFIDMFIRPMFCEGIGPFRLMAIDGDPETIYKIDARVAELFADVPRVASWLVKARQIKFSGLPARICWLGHGERATAAVAINDMIAAGEIVGPVAFSRDHLDAGSVTARFRETENMLDGSDCVADWPIINAILNGVAGADLTSVNGHGQRGLNSGPTTIADGTPEAATRLRRVMNADTGLGVIRQADAGFDIAVRARERYGLTVDVG